MRVALAAAAALALSLACDRAAAGEPMYTILSFEELDGWAQDDHSDALAVFASTCGDMKGPDWAAVCAVAGEAPSARPFFELLFRPVLVEDGAPMLFTAYFEPELNGSRTRHDAFQYPLYALPPDLEEELEDGKWHSRAEIEEEGLLEGRDLEIAFVDDPVDAYFLQIQGSGRVRLDDGTAIRVGYGGKNGHEYRSVGLELARRGEVEEHQVSAEVIRNWVKDNPEEGAELLRHNPSFVFFREVSQVPWDKGPLGAMNRSITAMRSLAVDPATTPLGAPVWIEKEGAEPLRRLMVAQDTGSVIKGAQRADIFVGFGEAAGREAGRIRDPGRMVVLMPILTAYGLVPAF